MEDAELRKLAKQTGLDLKQIAYWHFVHGPRYWSPSGRRKGKKKRPEGTLSLGDIIKKYRIDFSTLKKWRHAGLKSRAMGTMVLIRETDLKRWIAEHRNSRV